MPKRAEAPTTTATPSEAKVWPDVLGPAELAEFMGVKRSTVQQWAFRRVLPERDLTINRGPAWKRTTIVGWAVRTGRIPADDSRANLARPKKAASG